MMDPAKDDGGRLVSPDEETCTGTDLLKTLDVWKASGLNTGMTRSVPGILRAFYDQLVGHLGGEREAEIAVCKCTGIQPSEYRKTKAIERVPWLEKAIAAAESDEQWYVGSKTRIASRLGIDRKTLNQWIDDGKLDIRGSGQRWRIRQSDLEKLADR